MSRLKRSAKDKRSDLLPGGIMRKSKSGRALRLSFALLFNLDIVFEMEHLVEKDFTDAFPKCRQFMQPVEISSVIPGSRAALRRFGKKLKKTI